MRKKTQAQIYNESSRILPRVYFILGMQSKIMGYYFFGPTKYAKYNKMILHFYAIWTAILQFVYVWGEHFN